jgi:hypothetical protein
MSLNQINKLEDPVETKYRTEVDLIDVIGTTIVIKPKMFRAKFCQIS